MLDHNWVNKLPPAVVGAEPASDIPGANPDSVIGASGGLEMVGGVGGGGGGWLKNLVEIFRSLSRKAFVRNNARRYVGAAYLFLSRSVSTELRRRRLICVTRAWMSLPGKEPGPSLPGSHIKNSGPQREGWGNVRDHGITLQHLLFPGLKPQGSVPRSA